MNDKLHNNLSESCSIEKALRESEEIMRYIVRHNPNAIAIYDRELHYIAVSDHYLRDYEIKECDIIGRHHYEVFPEMPQRWKEIHQRCLAGAIESREDDCFIRADGSVTYNRWECRPWHRLNGEIGGIITYTEVTTERRKVERALKETNTKLIHAQHVAKIGSWENSLDTNDLLWSEEMYHILGFAPNTFISMIGTTQDITERKLAEKKLKHITRMYALLSQINQAIVQIKNQDELFLKICQVSIDFGQFRMAWIGMVDETEAWLKPIVHAGHEDGYLDGITLAIGPQIQGLGPSGLAFRQGRIISSTDIATDPKMLPWRDKALQRGYRSSAAVPFRRKGKTIGTLTLYAGDSDFFTDDEQSLLLEIGEDISFALDAMGSEADRVNAEMALHESEKLYRNLFENMLNGFAYCRMIFEQDQPVDFTYLAVNNAFEIQTGLKDVTGKKVSEVIPGFRESNTALLEVYGKVALTGQPESIEVYVEGLNMWFSASVYSPQKEYFVAQFDVITARKKAEEVLRQSEAKFRKLINSLPDAVIVVDTHGRINYCNQIAVKTFSYPIDEMLGCAIETLIPLQLREKHVQLRNAYIDAPISRPMGEGNVFFARRKDGSEFPTEIMIEPVEINSNQCVLAIVRDITERKQTENELISAKEKAEESDRLKSSFLANMSHEVRTPLNGIIGFSELLSDPEFNEEQKKEFIDQIINNGKNLLTIISDILDISRLEAGEVRIRNKKIKVQKFISDIREQFSFQVEAKSLSLILNLPETDHEIELFTDPARLSQIFNNLIGNALKFTLQGHIEIGYYIRGAMTEFYVRDTGIGIPEEYQNKIFDRFRQVEDAQTRAYGGNGLGLAITKNLVGLMGGRIWLESEAGKGSAFYFTIPCEDKPGSV